MLLICCALSSQAQVSYATVYARRNIERADENRNGRLEKSELGKAWNRIGHLDVDGDHALSLDEYAEIDIPYLPTNGEKELNIKFKTTPEEDLYLDIYYPCQSEKKNLPVLVYTHGGGWINGSKENITKGLIQETFLKLVENGFAVVSINYRLVRHDSVAMRDCVVDAMDALRYLSKHANRLGLNVNRVYLFGDSAGGHLAQMLTLADPSKFPGDKSLIHHKYKVIAGVSWYGPSDFTKIELFETADTSKVPDRFRERIMKSGWNPVLKDEMYKEMSPVYYLKKSSPPLYMMEADKDTTIPVGHAYHMKEKSDSVNANVEMLIVKNAGHNWRVAGGERDPSPEVITQKTVDFFLKYK